MTILNTQDGYGALTKFFHWLIVGLFAFQFAAANIMLRIDFDETALGLSQATYYNWHKSIGLLALVVAVLRLLVRKSGQLPAWAPTLTTRERRFVHRAEQLFYTAMFVMPLSGYLYVMAGGYGVVLFGVLDLTNPIGKHESLAIAAKWTHIVSSYALLLTFIGHVGLVLRHQVLLKDRLLHRMLPSRRNTSRLRSGLQRINARRTPSD
jgi:cytochrome b561